MHASTESQQQQQQQQQQYHTISPQPTSNLTIKVPSFDLDTSVAQISSPGAMAGLVRWQGW